MCFGCWCQSLYGLLTSPHLTSPQWTHRLPMWFHRCFQTSKETHKTWLTDYKNHLAAFKWALSMLFSTPAGTATTVSLPYLLSQQPSKHQSTGNSHRFDFCHVSHVYILLSLIVRHQLAVPQNAAANQRLRTITCGRVQAVDHDHCFYIWIIEPHFTSFT